MVTEIILFVVTTGISMALLFFLGARFESLRRTEQIIRLYRKTMANEALTKEQKKAVETYAFLLLKDEKEE